MTIDSEVMCKVCGKSVSIDSSKIFKNIICNCTDSSGKLCTTKGAKRARNAFVIYDDCAEIILTNMHYVEVARTLIDLDDVETVIQYKWHAIFPGPYVVSAKRYANGGKSIRLNRLIMETADESILVDHINNNTLDNRKSNLRLSNKIENGRNAKLSKRNSSGVKGVDWCPDRKRFRANIVVNYKQVFLGRYKTLEEAENAVRVARLHYHGEFANHG